MIVKDARYAIRAWAIYRAALKFEHPGSSLYTQGSQRLSGLHNPLAACLCADCSGFFEDLYAWAGAPLPVSLAYDPYTGTEIRFGTETTLDRLRVADSVIYFDGPGFEPSTGSHIAVVVGLGPDPLTVSFGQQSEPALVRVSQDGRAHKFFTYNTMTKGKIHYPPGYKKSRDPLHP